MTQYIWVKCIKLDRFSIILSEVLCNTFASYALQIDFFDPKINWEWLKDHDYNQYHQSSG